MTTVPFPHYEARLFDGGIIDQLHRTGAVLIRDLDVNDNRALLTICQFIGRPTQARNPDAESRGIVEDGFVHRVEALLSPLKDRHGAAVLSTTNLEFQLHTDEFFADNPAEVVLLHCVRSAQDGGASIFSVVNDIVPLLSAGAIDQLMNSFFPAGNSLVHLLWRKEGNWNARFNPYELSYAVGALSKDQRSAISMFEHVATACSFRMALEPGDCLIWLNHRMVHGRESFGPGQERLLKRVRLHVNDPRGMRAFSGSGGS